MSKWVLLIFLPLVPLLAWPYRLHRESQRLEQPIVVFEASFWRALSWTVPWLGMAVFTLFLAFHLIQRPGAGFATLLGAILVALPGVWLGFVLLRLHLSYWQHDRNTTLTIYRQEQRVDYCSEEQQLNFALTDVVHLKKYSATANGSRGSLWSQYSYHVFFLQDGTQLLTTCLLYSLFSPQELFSKAAYSSVQQFICWLPGDEVGNRPLY